MATIRFTANLARHRAAGPLSGEGATVRAVLDTAMADDALMKSYVVDEQGRLRKHVNIFVDGTVIRDRQGLTDPAGPASEIYIMQALSGG